MASFAAENFAIFKKALCDPVKRQLLKQLETHI